MEKFSISLEKILNQLEKYHLLVDYKNDRNYNNFIVENISYNSKETGENSLFFCKGVTFKKEYLIQAIQNGTKIYLSEINYEIENVFFIKVNDIRKAMSIIAAAYFDFPAEKMKLIAITGTKGKTTTTYFIKNILDKFLPYQSGVLSTVETYTGGISLESHFSTPESVDLQRFLAEAAENKIKYLTLEASSLGCKLDRIFGINFDFGLFLNLDEDHIGGGEHTDFNDYFQSKLILMKNCKTAIINNDCLNFNEIYSVAKKYAQKVILLGEEGDYHIENIQKQKFGFTFDVYDNDNKSVNFEISQEGRFNIKNALCAITVGRELGINDDIIKSGIQNVSIKGRMNAFQNDKVKVIVDYAHNNLSFEQIFKSFKLDYPESKITVVCGAPGDRAFLRRRDIGTLCGKYADMVYLTTDDPGFEDVVKICNEISGYISSFNKPFEIIIDRTVAIERAILNAKKSNKNEIVIVAGKGEEVYQKIKGKFEYYESDLSIVKRML